MSISSSALLVHLNISTWTGSKLDKDQTARVIERNNAVSKSARVYKNFAAGVRLFHNQWTLPYEDRGNRIIPTSLFMDYKAQYNLKRAEFLMRVNKFKDYYYEHAQSARNSLGGLHNANDYPSVETIASKFAFELSVKPMPTSGHFILDIPAQDMEEMKQQLDAENDKRLKEATGTAWHRLHKVISDMSQKLEPVGGMDKRRWYDSFVSNPRELCDMLTHLNITKDPELERARAMLEATMANTNIDAIKDSEHERTRIKSDVDNILKQFEW